MHVCFRYAESKMVPHGSSLCAAVGLEGANNSAQFALPSDRHLLYFCEGGNILTEEGFWPPSTPMRVYATSEFNNWLPGRQLAVRQIESYRIM